MIKQLRGEAHRCETAETAFQIPQSEHGGCYRRLYLETSLGGQSRQAATGASRSRFYTVRSEGERGLTSLSFSNFLEVLFSMWYNTDIIERLKHNREYVV
jgi:hypothetical protein